jgi:hypothetical protein
MFKECKVKCLLCSLCRQPYSGKNSDGSCCQAPYSCDTWTGWKVPTVYWWLCWFESMTSNPIFPILASDLSKYVANDSWFVVLFVEIRSASTGLFAETNSEIHANFKSNDKLWLSVDHLWQRESCWYCYYFKCFLDCAVGFSKTNMPGEMGFQWWTSMYFSWLFVGTRAHCAESGILLQHLHFHFSLTHTYP